MNTLLLVGGLAVVTIAAAHLLVTGREILGGWTRRLRLALLLAPPIAVLTWWWGWLPWPITLLLVAVTAVVVWRRRSHHAEQVRRMGQATRRKHGLASWIDVVWYGSVWRARRKARVLRPSLAGMTRRELWRHPATEYACRVARTSRFLWVWTNIEYVTLIFGGPRKGKSGAIANRILDAPGAALATSTRADLWDLTHRRRAHHGPVYVFNPVGLGELPSTVTFDPLTGCDEPAAAYQRATDLLGVSDSDRTGGSEHGYWENQSRRVLTALLHAAAIGHRSMLDVYRWVADPETNKGEIMKLLLRGNVDAYVPDVEQFVGTNHETRSSITTGVTPGLGWLTSQPAVRAAAPGTVLDVEQMLRTRATIYLIGDPETQSTALVRALTGYLAREARRIAGTTRLDPPLLLALDEAGLLAPPLERWTADMGGRGVTIVAAFQSRAQMLTRWSGPEAGTIQNNAGTTVLFGGTGDEADLRYWAMRIGNRDEPQVTTNLHGKVTSRTTRKVPVLEPNQINALPEGQAVVFHSGMPPVIGRVPMAWARRETSRAAAARAHLARLRIRVVHRTVPRPAAAGKAA